MLAFLHQPRHLVDAEALPAGLFGAQACPAIMRGCMAQCAKGLVPAGSMQLTRSQDAYTVSAALPGVKAEEISRIEVIGNRTIHVQVQQQRAPIARPPASASAAATSRVDAAQKSADAATKTPEQEPEEIVVVEAPASADPAAHSAAAAAAAAAESEPEQAAPEPVIVVDAQLTLPQPVDTAGITCSYQDGLLRIHVPIVAPGPDEEHRDLVDALEQEATIAASMVADLEQQLREQKAKAREAQLAVHAAKVGVHRALQARRHALTIA